jgi:hypothetical protein
MCRTKITSQNRSIVFDTFIDRIVENLSVEMKNRRQEVIEDRQGMCVINQTCVPLHDISG